MNLKIKFMDLEASRGTSTTIIQSSNVPSRGSEEILAILSIQMGCSFLQGLHDERFCIKHKRKSNDVFFLAALNLMDGFGSAGRLGPITPEGARCPKPHAFVPNAHAHQDRPAGGKSIWQQHFI
ncbi:hypothetical protein POX_a00621 [Penicillium oxalicum]|uniref:hypothetical protein n=1 Tax=Penicillium oxalicum TaxID=69781 RepID=UPI0020B7F44B|nr:hypothetical protein POX_a00621 [Penicillium oxalicum]KAI2794031.1 hypothetical protein POX_a00621 [Penicillium oxalicum]